MNKSLTKKPTNPKTQKPSAVCKQIFVNSAQEKLTFEQPGSYSPDPQACVVDKHLSDQALYTS